MRHRGLGTLHVAICSDWPESSPHLHHKRAHRRLDLNVRCLRRHDCCCCCCFARSESAQGVEVAGGGEAVMANSYSATTNIASHLIR